MSAINTKQLYDERLKRIQDAASLKEPDRIPILEPGTNSFPYFDAGYTMAEILYDVEKTKDAIRKYLTHYEPDAGHTYASCFEGQGPMLEKSQSKTFRWAGMPGGYIPDDSIHQFIEFPLVHDDDFGDLLHDRTALALKKYFPRSYGLMEPFENLNFSNMLAFGAFNYLDLAALATPEVQSVFKQIAELAGMWGNYFEDVGAFAAEVEDMGFPIATGSPLLASFDFYSDMLRGTMGASMDLYDRPDEVYAFLCELNHDTIEKLKNTPAQPGRMVFIPMHKGMDGFLSDEHYEKFYWRHLFEIILNIIDRDMIPYVYTEGKYTTRMKFLKELPKGKTVVHFEEIDMAVAKQELKDIACITGKYPAQLLQTGSKDKVIDEAKRLMDICAPGGGYMFDFDGGLYESKRENVEALFDTIKTYGKYK